MSKALFLDRDGTLVVDTHYLHKPEDLQLIAGIGDALQTALTSGYLLFLFTNQSGIGRGFYTLEDAEYCNQCMVEMLGFRENPFTEICIAPETPEDAPVYRKPSPRFILEMCDKYDLNPDFCWMVGDKLCDIQAGLNGGIRAAFVRSGKTSDGEPTDFLAEYSIPTFDTLVSFVDELTG